LTTNPLQRALVVGTSLATLALALGGGSVARAAQLDEELDGLDTKSSDLAARAASIENETRPGQYLTESEAVSRFQDYLFEHLIGEHEPAAEGFFALVTTGVLSDAGLHRDAEWYLAESLVGLENYKTAASRYKAIVDDPNHPFRDDAVRRLLELYAMSGDKEAFDALYRAEIVTGKVKPTGLITYSLAKSFYEQGELEQAATNFGQVPQDNAWYGRARYFLGVIHVRAGELDAAKTEFQTVVDLSITTTEDRMVHDLALLALGRISYNNGDYIAASEFYNRIGGDSQYQADKLYEIIWTSIRREKWQDALNNVEIFLLAYPEHEYSAQLRLLQGHLNFQEQHWNDALGAYEQVVSEYTPVQARFAELAAPGSDAEGAVRAVVEERAESVQLPPYAVSMMRADPEMSRAIDVFRDLDLEQQDIEASERLIDELRSFIVGSGAIGSFDRTKTDTLVARQGVIDSELKLLDLDGRWLGSLHDPSIDQSLSDWTAARKTAADRSAAVGETIAHAATDLSAFERSMGEIHAEADNARRDASDHESAITAARQQLADPKLEDAARTDLANKVNTLEAELATLRKTQEDADARMAQMKAPTTLAQVDVNEMSAVHAEVARLLDAARSMRPTKPGVLEGDRIDGLAVSLEDTNTKLDTVYQSISNNQGVEVNGIRQRFDQEVGAVAQERTDYDQTLGAARTVSLDITRHGFGRLEDFFSDSVVKADMGVVDVFWAQKLETADELDRVRTEREQQMDELERRFSLILENMGEGK